MPKMMPVASAEAEGEKRIFFSKNMLRLQTSTPLINQNCWGKQEHTHTPKKKKISPERKKKTNKKYSLVNLLLANPQRAYRAQ